MVGAKGLQLLPFDRSQHEVITAELRAKLDYRTWDAAWDSGRHLSLDRTIALAQTLAC